MAEDWWAAATAAATSGTQLLLNGSPDSAPPQSSTQAQMQRPQSLRAVSTNGQRPMGDALLAGLSQNGTQHSRASAPRARQRLALQQQQRRPQQQQRVEGVPLDGVALHELVENATGHARPRGMADVQAARTIINNVCARRMKLELVFKTLVHGSNPLADASYNISVLSFIHQLLSAGSHALPTAASAAVNRSPYRLLADVHRAARRARGQTNVVDIRNDIAYRDLISSQPPTSSSSATITCRAVEAYALLLTRRLTFASMFPETEANLSLDRWYRRISIENQPATFIAARQKRLRAPETRAQILVILDLVVCTATLLLARPRAVSPDILATIIAEGANAYVFAEYLRKRSQRADDPPTEEQRALCDIVRAIVPETRRRDDVDDADEGTAAVALANFANIDVAVAAEMLKKPGRVARAIRIESRYRRDILCTFSSFTTLHAALDPFSITGNHAHTR